MYVVKMKAMLSFDALLELYVGIFIIYYEVRINKYGVRRNAVLLNYKCNL